MSTCKARTPINDLSICSSYWRTVDWISPLMKAYIYCVSIIIITCWCICITIISFCSPIIVLGFMCFVILNLNRFISHIFTEEGLSFGTRIRICIKALNHLICEHTLERAVFSIYRSFKGEHGKKLFFNTSISLLSTKIATIGFCDRFFNIN